MLVPGEVLDKRYRLDHRLATGGMGDVWRATDTVLGRPVAVKVMLPALLTDPGFTARFQAEARMMAALRHPGVVQVYDYGQSTVTAGEVVYLVMNYVDGEPLSRRLAATGRLPVAETLAMVAQAADALHAVHRSGIVHRDVKPANLLVQPDGTVVLVDFGVAHSASATKLTGTGTILGTALYMAPEQVSGEPVSGATDVYALGALTFHCLAGRPPFEGDTPLQVAYHQVHDDPPPLPGDLPEPVRAMVARALAKDPADRYPDAAAFAGAARAALAGAGVAAVVGADAQTVAVTPPAAGPATLHDLPVVPGPDDQGPAGPAGQAEDPAGSARRPGRRTALLAAAVGVPVLLVVAAVALMLRPSDNPTVHVPRPGSSATTGASVPTTARNAGTGTKPSTGPTRTAAPTTAPPTTSAPTSNPKPTSGSTGGPQPTSVATTAGAPGATATADAGGGNGAGNGGGNGNGNGDDDGQGAGR